MLKRRSILLIIGVALLILLLVGFVISLNFFKQEENVEEKQDKTTLNSIVTTTIIEQEISSTVTTKEGETSTKNNKTTTKTNTTTKTVSTTKKEETTQIVKSSERIIEDYKYGVKKISDIEYETIVYADGSEEKKKVGSFVTYDTKGFNATTNDLKAEAQELMVKNSSIYQEIVNNVNAYRSEVGKTGLILDADLTLAATIRALEMAWSSKYSHTRADGRDCYTVYDDLGYVYTAAGENIAKGYSSAASVSKGWYNSKGHYENMISDNFGRIGIGFANANSTNYWVQLFAN